MRTAAESVGDVIIVHKLKRDSRNQVIRTQMGLTDSRNGIRPIDFERKIVVLEDVVFKVCNFMLVTEFSDRNNN